MALCSYLSVGVNFVLFACSLLVRLFTLELVLDFTLFTGGLLAHFPLVAIWLLVSLICLKGSGK